MSSNTPTPKFEDAVQAGLEQNDLTPEEFDREEAERKKAMARAFALRDTPGQDITPGDDDPAKKD